MNSRNNSIVMLIAFILFSTCYSQRTLTRHQLFRARQKMAELKKMRPGLYSEKKEHREINVTGGSGRTINQVSISIREISGAHINKLYFFTGPDKEAFKKARKHFAMYKITYFNNSSGEVKFDPVTYGFYEKRKGARVEVIKHMDSMDKSFLNSFHRYYGSIITKVLKPGRSSYLYIMLPRVKVLTATLGVSFATGAYERAVFKLKDGFSTVIKPKENDDN